MFINTQEFYGLIGGTKFLFLSFFSETFFLSYNGDINMNQKRIKQPKRSYTSLTGVVPVRNHNENGMLVNELVAFESQLERDFILRSSFCTDCYSIRRCKPIKWSEGRKERKYEPDFDVKTCDVNQVPVERYLVEVKMAQDLKKKADDLEPKFAVAREHCKAQGWHFLVKTEDDIQDQFLRNAIFLREFRATPGLQYPLSEDSGVESKIVDLLFDLGETTPSHLLACLSDDKWERAAYIPYVWRLLCNHEIRTDLLEPLTMESTIWHPEDNKMEELVWKCF